MEGGNFFPAERRAQATGYVPMRLRSRAFLCFECGLLWMRADVEAALNLVRQIGTPELQRRVKDWQKLGSHMLLRASNAPSEAASEILLRPAAGSIPTLPEELLRPSEEQNKDDALDT